MALVCDLDGRRGLKRKYGCVDPFLQLGRPNPLEARYVQFDQELGKGAFGSVNLFKRIKGSEFHRYAIKSVMKNKQNARVHEEVELMQHLSGHNGVVNLQEVLESNDKYYLIMELCEGGSLWDIMKKAGSAKCSTEKDAATLMRNLVSIIKYVHEMGVAHRDIKPQNILFSKNGEMKLADFGLAARIGRTLSGDVGTPLYMAPEILSEEKSSNYDQKIDIWSAGILLHLLLLGRLPFEGQSEAIYEAVRAFDGLDFHTEEWSSVSLSARDLLAKMLRRDAESRISLDEILRHPWIVLNACDAGPIERDEKEILMEELESALKSLKLPKSPCYGPYLPVHEHYLYMRGKSMQAAY